jgi:hypothetical protein
MERVMMQRRIGFSLVALSLFALVACCGCGGGVSTAEVKGKVTLDGQPLTGGSVSFIPAQDATKGAAGLMSAGEINAQGEFTLGCANGKPGATVGTHQVTVRPAFGGGSTPTGTAPAAAGKVQAVPPKYSDPATSGLKAEVKAGIVNQITLELSSK